MSDKDEDRRFVESTFAEWIPFPNTLTGSVKWGWPCLWFSAPGVSVRRAGLLLIAEVALSMR